MQKLSLMLLAGLIVSVTACSNGTVKTDGEVLSAPLEEISVEEIVPVTPEASPDTGKVGDEANGHEDDDSPATSDQTPPEQEPTKDFVPVVVPPDHEFGVKDKGTRSISLDGIDFSLASDTTSPEFEGVSLYGLGQKFVMKIFFSELIDLDALVANRSITLYRRSLGGYIPMKGSMVATPNSAGIIGTTITFYDEDDQYDQKTNADPLSHYYMLKILGADSAEPSRAIKDKAGNPLKNEVTETGMCIDSTKTDQSPEVPCQ